MDEILRDILSKAILAPSGDNCQPWKIRLRDGAIDLYVVPEEDNSLYNFNSYAVYVSAGAVLENVMVAAGYHGYTVQYELFPDAADATYVARITLGNQYHSEAASTNDAALYKAISDRATTRKPYQFGTVSAELANHLSEAAGSDLSAQLSITRDQAVIKRLASHVANNERILFGNRTMHGFFFEHVVWSKEDAQKKGTGFFIDTLELPPPAKKIFPFWKRWSIMRLFGLLGFLGIVAKDNAALYAQSGAVGAIIIPKIGAKEYAEAGMLLERVWLAATQAGLKFQPLAGIAFLHHRISLGLSDEFTRNERTIIDAAYQGIINEMQIPASMKLVALFRTGIGEAPTARSHRRPLENFILP